MKTAAAIITLLAWLAGIAVAHAETVDLLLVLAADVSRSIDDVEFNLQRKGYASAITDPRVLRAIAGGRNHAIAVTFIEWSGAEAQKIVADWMVIRDDETALAILHQLRAIGVRIALDDFGTGYSSLSYLKRFPFDKIKIDRCFIGDIAEIDGSSAIVQAVVNIAAARKMTTTAEGVETLEQQELLRTLGCTEMQGFLFSAAKPGPEVRKLFGPRRERAAAVA